MLMEWIRSMPRIVLLVLVGSLLSLLPAVAQQPSIRDETVHGRQAYVLENGKMRVSALRGGGHLAEIRFLSRDPRKAVNPMYVPDYQTIEPYEYDPEKHGDRWRGPGRYLSAGYMGHLLTFPNFGPPSSKEEIENGLGFHGEAVMVEWKQYQRPKVEEQGVTLYYGADLPRTQYRVERAITLPANGTVVHVEEWIENLELFDRPYNRDQHVTFGKPFVEPGKNFLDLSGTKGLIDPKRERNNSLQAGLEFQWPMGARADGSPASLREFIDAPRTSTLFAVLADPSREQSYFTVYHSDYPVLIGYLFPTADNPWLVDYQGNQSNVVRAVEFGTTPIDEGLRRSVDRGALFDVPAFQWIAGRQRLKTTFTIFLAEIPTGFAGVEDVRSEPGKIVITERGTKRQITVANAGR
jgi:hypothetical protein